MDLKRFFEIHRLSLLERILHDKDLAIDLHWSGSKITLPEKWSPNYTIDTPKRIEFFALKDLSAVEERHFGHHLRRYSNTFFEREDVMYLLEKNEKLAFEISSIKSIFLDESLINKYRTLWNWYALSKNSSIVWTDREIEIFEKFVKFDALSYNTSLHVSEHCLEKFSEKWNWNGLSGNPSLINLNKQYLLSHSKTVWSHFPDSVYDREKYLDKHIFKRMYDSTFLSTQVKASISTNEGMVWNINEFDEHLDKIDLWLLSLHGRLDIKIVEKYSEVLAVNRVCGNRYARWSDWYDQHPIHVSGWQNYFKNDHLKITQEAWNFLKYKTTNIIDYLGDARDGFEKYEKSVALTKLLPTDKIDLPFDIVVSDLEHFSGDVISKYHVDEKFYVNLIKPALLAEPELLKLLFEQF